MMKKAYPADILNHNGSFREDFLTNLSAYTLIGLPTSAVFNNFYKI